MAVIRNKGPCLIGQTAGIQIDKRKGILSCNWKQIKLKKKKKKKKLLYIYHIVTCLFLLDIEAKRLFGILIKLTVTRRNAAQHLISNYIYNVRTWAAGQRLPGESHVVTRVAPQFGGEEEEKIKRAVGTFCSNQPSALEFIKTKKKKDQRFYLFMRVSSTESTTVAIFQNKTIYIFYRFDPIQSLTTQKKKKKKDLHNFFFIFDKFSNITGTTG